MTRRPPPSANDRPGPQDNSLQGRTACDRHTQTWFWPEATGSNVAEAHAVRSAPFIVNAPR